MAAPQQVTKKQFYTEDEYYAFSETAEERWEFTPVGPPGTDSAGLGRIRMMAGGSDDHATIVGNVARALGNALDARDCRTYVSDMRVHAGDGKHLFPDVAVVCGPREYHQGRTDTIINPLLVVEVLSPSTMSYDLGDKFGHYQTILSLADYLLVFQGQARAMLCSRRHGGHWDLQMIAGRDGTAHLTSVDVTLSLADVYARIEFNADAGAEQGPDGLV